MSDTQTTPEVTWAQRSSSSDPEKNFIYLTIAAPDVPKEKLQLDIKPTSLTFKGSSETKKTTYHLELEFYADIDVENSKTHHTSRDVLLVLRKKELKDEYWPRLLKESKKVHFLKTDFDKWVDEDEQEGAPVDDMMGGMGGGMGMPGMGGMEGMGGMGGMGGDGGFGGIDFSKLGGAGGMGGMGDDAADDDEDDDDEMPALEGDDEAADTTGDSKGKGTEKLSDTPAAADSKIEEVS
ncbi:MAG: hypothetical protein LQ346_003853 [Caloplaca aetnensis]|nr:MAG: hypothetical protein LQ346_003853 [Caloplaca aetnensis]